MFKSAVITISDSSSQGKRVDESGQIICGILKESGFHMELYKIVPDRVDEIRNTLMDAKKKRIDLIITTGGTGLTPGDVTPEATEPLLQRKIPGIMEAIRAKGMDDTPMAMLSRGLAGVSDGCLIINLPGSPSAVRTGMDCILPVLDHALKKIKGDPTPCHKAQP